MYKPPLYMCKPSLANFPGWLVILQAPTPLSENVQSILHVHTPLTFQMKSPHQCVSNLPSRFRLFDHTIFPRVCAWDPRAKRQEPHRICTDFWSGPKRTFWSAVGSVTPPVTCHQPHLLHVSKLNSHQALALPMGSGNANVRYARVQSTKLDVLSRLPRVCARTPYAVTYTRKNN